MKLITLIKKNSKYMCNDRVCYCYFNTKRVDLVPIEKLTQEQLNEKWYSSEWWIEGGDLCLMRGR